MPVDDLEKSHRTNCFRTLEALGPEHEFSIVDERLKPLPIVDELIKQQCGRMKNTATFRDFILSMELQKHVAELKPIAPFRSPIEFEHTMQQAVLEVSGFIEKLDAHLLGLGMHPTLSLDEVRVWDHRNRQIYKAFDEIFGLRAHGWLNIQSFQLNISYLDEQEAVEIYNALAQILPYVVAVSSASPIYESKIGEFGDNRLYFYAINQAKIPSIAGDIVPEPIDSFETYRALTIRRYSEDLKRAGAPSFMLNKEWINSRGATIRFDRKAIEIRIMDEQECIKSDVALSCFIRGLLRAMMAPESTNLGVFDLSYHLQVENLKAIIRKGLDAKIYGNRYGTARAMCQHLYEIAYDKASEDEKEYLWIVKKRIENGSLSEIISRNVQKKAEKTDLHEAILDVYFTLSEKLTKNEVYE